MGLLWDTPEERLRKERELARQSLLGTPDQAAQIGQLGRFSMPLTPAKEGTGYLGSDMGAAAQSDYMGGLLAAGYSPQEATGLLSTATPQQQEPTTFMQNFGAYQQADQKTRNLMDQYRKSGAMNINMGGGAGSIWKPEQVADAGLAPGTVVTEDRYGKPQILNKVKYTQPQILSGTYATRMDDATRTIREVMANGFDPAGVVQNVDILGAPDILANYMRTPEGQVYRQAQENWISANLRKESGAAIPEAEMDREIKKWFPYIGDSQETIAKKDASRITAERGMQKAAGGSYDELKNQSARDRLDELRRRNGIK